MWHLPRGDLIMAGEGHKDWVAGISFHPKVSQCVHSRYVLLSASISRWASMCTAIPFMAWGRKGGMCRLVEDPGRQSSPSTSKQAKGHATQPGWEAGGSLKLHAMVS